MTSPTRPEGEPHAHLHRAELTESDAPVVSREGFELARRVYCDPESFKEEYLADCARWPSPSVPGPAHPRRRRPQIPKGPVPGRYFEG